MAYICTTFEDSSFSRSKCIRRKTQKLNNIWQFGGLRLSPMPLFGKTHTSIWLPSRLSRKLCTASYL